MAKYKRKKKKKQAWFFLWIFGISFLCVYTLINLGSITDTLQNMQTGRDASTLAPSRTEDMRIIQKPKDIDTSRPQSLSLSPQNNVPEDIVQDTIEEKELPPEETHSIALYFFTFKNNTLNPIKVTRSIPKTSGILRKTIEQLLQGPTTQETQKGIISLIPKESSLLSLSLQNGTAFLNFNDAFQFNEKGREAYYGQLQQIVLSSVVYPSVSRVQFLIEGKQVNYLGGDGIPISANTRP